MATGGSPSPRSGHPVKSSSSDCPQCGSLCLGPVAFPCGHVICRRCLRDTLEEREDRISCQCGRDLPDFPRKMTTNQLAQELGTDPVMENLVQQELDNITDIRCLICSNVEAEKVCMDCQEYYCDRCSENHCKSRTLKDHVLCSLPQTLKNASPRDQDTSTARLRSSSAASTTSSIYNPADAQSLHSSRDKREWKKWVKDQKGQLKGASRNKAETRTILQDIVSLGIELSDRIQEDKQTVDTYQHHLTRFDVIAREDSNTYVIHSKGFDEDMIVKTESLENRLRYVMQGRHCLDHDALRAIRTQLDRMLHFSGQENSAQSSSFTNTTSPSIYLPTSATTPNPTTTRTTTLTHTHTAFTNTVNSQAMVTPRRLFSTQPSAADDRKRPGISAIISLPNDRLVMSDFNNKKVKVMNVVTPPYKVSASVAVQAKPRCLARLANEDTVAVTTTKASIFLIEVTERLKVKSEIKTVRKYQGVAGLSEGNLLVSCFESKEGPAALHVLTQRGEVLRTIHASSRLSGLESPWYICADDVEDRNHIFVGDFSKHLVHRIELSSGHVTHSFDHALISYPRQLCVDNTGAIFVACDQGDEEEEEGDGWVVVREKGGGQWRVLVTSDLSDPGYARPMGLCLTRGGRLVVTWSKPMGDSVLVCYGLA